MLTDAARCLSLVARRPSGRIVGPSAVYAGISWAVFAGPSFGMRWARSSSLSQLLLMLQATTLAHTSTSSGRHGSGSTPRMLNSGGSWRLRRLSR